jgi:chemotaxis protein MotB
MSRKPKGRAHVNHERWLVSYADFVTLLFALFVVMFSTSQVDQRKVGKLALAIQVAFEQMGVFPASTTQIPVNSAEPMPFSTVQAIENANRTSALGRVVESPQNAVPAAEENGDLTALRAELQKTLAAEIASKQLALRTVPDGLVISLREIGFFDSGSAHIRAASKATLDHIAALLSSRPYRLRIEGHTDNVPIHNPSYFSNWELSTSRATEIVRLLIVQYGFAPQRLSAAGYGAYHPVSDNQNAEGRAQNRRVDIVILGHFNAQP